MKIIYRKINGAVVMRSDGEVLFDTDTLASALHDPTPEEMASFEQNRPAFYIGGQLIFQDNPGDVQKRKKKVRDLLLKTMTDKRKTTDERFEALAELIKNTDQQ